MNEIKVIDNLSFFESKYFDRVIQKGEKLLWSGFFYKTNKWGKRQNRYFLLTDHRFINVGK